MVRDPGPSRAPSAIARRGLCLRGAGV